ncbi:MAG: DUF2029 domain-containing protein [Chloroflexota bacterium]|nr:DUF2029 domain-containing protein [Chloroflexota bacterium]
MMHKIHPSRWLLLCVPLLLACLLWQRGSATTIDIGIPGDQDILQGFYERETNAAETYRWTQQAAAIQLPGTYLPGTIGLRGTVAPGDTLVQIRLGDRSQVTLPSGDGISLRSYHLLAPAWADTWGWSTLNITVQQTQERIEERTLGLLLTSVWLHTMRPITLLPLVILGILGLLPLVFALCARFVGLGERPSILLGLLFGLITVGIWHTRPLWIQQYLPMWLPVLIGLGGLLLWMRSASTRLKYGPTASMLTIFVVSAGLIPLYLLLKYGLHTALHWHNLPVLAMLVALPLPFVRVHARRALLAVAVIAVIGYGLMHFYDAVRVDYATDFKPLFRGPRSLLDGGNLYDLEAIHANHLGTTYKYPPFFVLVMGPLTDLSFSAAIHIWRAFNSILIVVSAWLLWRWSGRPLRSWSTLALIYMVLAFQQLMDTLGYAQVDIIVLAGLAAALWSLGRQRWTWWAVALAVPAAIKLYPAYLVVHGVALRRWQSLLAFLVAFGALAALSILFLGLDVHVTYVREVLPLIGGGTAWIENQTLNGFLNRLSGAPIKLQPDPLKVVRSLTYFGALLLTVLTWARVQRLTPTAGFGLWMVTMLMLLPAAWIHYQVILLIPFYQAFVRSEHSPDDVAWHSLVLYALAWLLLCYGNQWTFFDNKLHGPIWSLVLSYKFYGLLLLWWGIAYDPSARSVWEEIGSRKQTLLPMITKHA